jgi:hypothetical protein
MGDISRSPGKRNDEAIGSNRYQMLQRFLLTIGWPALHANAC